MEFPAWSNTTPGAVPFVIAILPEPVIPPAASKVNTVFELQARLLATVMLPVSVPLLPVETVTLPVPRAVCNAVALITEGLPVAVLPDELVAAALEMVRS